MSLTSGAERYGLAILPGEWRKPVSINGSTLAESTTMPTDDETGGRWRLAANAQPKEVTL